MTYELNTLALSTRFDEPVTALEVPGLATAGNDCRSICMLDGATRGPFKLARLVKNVALLGLRVERPGSDVLVEVGLVADDLSHDMWARRENRDEADTTPERGRHRLVEVWAQGRTRALTLLNRQRGEAGVHQRIRFLVTAEELSDGGVLMLGFETPGFVPAWARNHVLEDGLLGVGIEEVKIIPVGKDLPPGRLSSGRPRGQGGVPVLGRGGLLTVNPMYPGAEGVLRLRPESGSLADTLVRVSRKVRRTVGLPSGTPRLPNVEVEVVTVEGRSLLSRSVAASAGDYSVELPPLSTPAYVRVHSKLPGLAAARGPAWRAKLVTR